MAKGTIKRKINRYPERDTYGEGLTTSESKYGWGSFDIWCRACKIKIKERTKYWSCWCRAQNWCRSQDW